MRPLHSLCLILIPLTLMACAPQSTPAHSPLQPNDPPPAQTTPSASKKMDLSRGIYTAFEQGERKNATVQKPVFMSVAHIDSKLPADFRAELKKPSEKQSLTDSVLKERLAALTQTFSPDAPMIDPNATPHHFMMTQGHSVYVCTLFHTTLKAPKAAAAMVCEIGSDVGDNMPTAP